MTRLAVVGASGRTGRAVVAQALAAGHQVTAVARHPEAVAAAREGLRTVQGDVLEADSLVEPLAGQDAVISLVHTRSHSTTTLYSHGMVNILDAMSQAGVKRLVCATSHLVVVPAGASLPRQVLIRLFTQKMLRNPLLDMERMENELAYGEVNWTVVRVPRLVDGPRTGEYRRSFDGPLPRPGRISRDDLADCLLRVLDDDRSYRTRVHISY